MNPSVQRHDDTRFLDLLQRWQSGDFTRADEQELNALAASDNFRREAMEGFMSMPETAHDERLAALRARLRHQTVGGQGRRLTLVPYIWAAAAVLILLLAAIWFFPMNDQKDAAPIAQNEVEVTGQGLPDETAPASEIPENKDIATKEPFLKTMPSSPVPRQETRDDPSFAAPGSTGAFATDAAKVEDVAMEESEGQQREYVVVPPQVPNAAPIRAPQEEAADNVVAQAEKQNNAAKPSVARAQEAAKAKKSKSANRPTDSIWHETDAKPDMDAQRKKARDETQTQESEPADGWENFSEYLRQNARLTLEARNNNASGTVRLQFYINANGDPQGFVVLRSVGYGCDQEAIRLVQGREWVRGKNPVVTVDIPFVR